MSAEAALAPGSATYHSNALISATIGKHPRRTAVLIGVLILSVIILAVYHYRAKLRADACAAGGKSGYQTGLARLNNLNTGSHWNMWHLGADSAAGANSTVGRVPDSLGSAYRGLTNHMDRPGVRQFMMAKAARAGRMKAAGKEGMYAQPCKPGDVEYTKADGTVVCATPQELAVANSPLMDDQEGVDQGDQWDMSTCGSTWDPAAVADTQALTALGAIEGEATGESRLQAIVDGDPSAVLSDKQLTTLLYQGGAP